MERILVVVLAGCFGGASGQPTTVAAPANPDWVTIESPHVPRTNFVVTAPELGDPGIDQRLAYRTRLRRSGKVWLQLDGKPIRERLDSYLRGTEISVLDATRDHLRIVSSDDGARIALWMAREDAGASVVVPIELADRDGKAHARSGVWLDVGAQLATVGAVVDRRREVTIKDEVVEARGWVPANVVDEVWPVQPKRPAQAGPKLTLAAHVEIRVAGDPNAPAIAKTLDDVEVRASGDGDWREIELERPFGRVRGFVPATKLASDAHLSIHGTGGGHGFGMSHSDRVKLPAGACLFGAANGDVLGVNLDDRERYAHRPSESPGWWKVYVDTPWSAVIVFAHDVKNDMQNPEWEPCGSFSH